MVNTLPLRVFLASPGDLEDERNAVRRCVSDHAARAASGGVTYELIEWNRVRGTARRPQEAINELISECHFMIVLFRHDWGSTPGSPWGYSSGTEEELFTGLLDLGQPEQPMRDLWIGFLGDASPDDRIVALRQQIVDRNALMFESIADVGDLKTKLIKLLETWEARDHKTPSHVDLLPSSGKDVLRASNLRIQGEKLVDLGMRDAGHGALKEAASVGGPTEQLAYATFLRREGDLNGAHIAIQQAIDYLVMAGPLYSPLAADAFSAQAGVLSSQHRDNEAIGKLRHALTLLRGADTYSQTIRCRILDQLGLGLMRIGDKSSAREHYEEALDLRRATNDATAVAQSLVNLARLEVSEGHLSTADDYATEAANLLRRMPPSGLCANAEVLVAQVRLRQGRAEEGIPPAKRALSQNRQIANRHGEAISLLVLAQCCRESAQIEAAEKYGRECLKLNQSIDDAHGAEKAQWLLDNLVR